MTAAHNPNTAGNALPPSADEFLANQNEYIQNYLPRNIADAQRLVDQTREVADNEFHWIGQDICEYDGEEVDPDVAEEYQEFADRGLDNWVLSQDDHDFYTDVATFRAVRGFKAMPKDLKEQLEFQRRTNDKGETEPDDALLHRVQKEAAQRLKLDEAIADFKAKGGEAQEDQPSLTEDLEGLNDYLADEWNVPSPDSLEEADELMKSLTRNPNGSYSNSRGERASADLVEDIDDKLDRNNFLLTDTELAVREDILDARSPEGLQNSDYWDEIADLLDKYEDDMYQRGENVGDLADYIEDLKDWCEKSIELHDWLEDNPDFLKTEAVTRQKKPRKGKTEANDPTTRTKEQMDKLTSPSKAALDTFGGEDAYKYELLFEELQDALGRNPTAKEMNQYLPGSGDALSRSDRGKAVKLPANTAEFRAPKVKAPRPARFVKLRETMRGVGESIRTKAALGSAALADTLARPDTDDADDDATTTTTRGRSSGAPRGGRGRGGRHV